VLFRSQLSAVHDLHRFERFVRLCAGRTGQMLNLSNLGNDAGVSHATASAWLDLLQTSCLIYLLPPWHTHTRKRLVKTPKLYFLDAGLACWLLGIRSEEVLTMHPSRGALFETLVVSEFIKQRFNQGKPADLYFWRDNSGLEADLLFEKKGRLQLAEIKSGQTVTTDYIRAARCDCEFWTNCSDIAIAIRIWKYDKTVCSWIKKISCFTF
jgi:predicted AAA+ superfamily ATPase